MSFGMTETQARELMQRVLRFSKADACEVNLNGNAGGNVRAQPVAPRGNKAYRLTSI